MKKHILSALFLCLFASFQHKTLAQVGEVLNFNGAGDYLSTANNFQLTSFTIEAWVNTSATGNQTIISTGDGNGNGDENFIFQIQGGKIGLYMAQAGGNFNWNLTAPVVPNFTWCHVAVSYDNTTHIASFYLDGKFVSNANYPSANPNFSTGGVFVGRQGYGCQCNYFNGSMDELRIWNTALSCDNINLNKFTTPNALQIGLVAAYRFNQGIAGGDNTGITTVSDTKLANPLTINSLSRNGTSSNFILGGPTIAGSTDLSKTVEINIIDQTNTFSINNGDISPNSSDGTDFGNVDISSGPISKTFKIQNLGNSGLKLFGSPYVSITGVGFSLDVDAIGIVPGGSFSFFTVSFDPSLIGIANGTVSIINEDCDEGNYTFSIKGNGTTPGEVLYFDGTNDVIETGFVPGAAVMKHFTYECWVKGDFAPRDTLFSGPMYAFKSGIIWDHMDGAYRGGATVYDQGGTPHTASFGALSGNTWYHLAATYDGSTLRSYKDGVLITSTPVPVGGIFDEATTLKLGTHPGGSLGFFAGQIDEAKVWSRALSGAEIAANMNCELSGPQECLELYYKCNQGVSGGNNASELALQDFSGKARNGTFMNFALSGPTSNFNDGSLVSGSCSPAAFPEVNVRQAATNILTGGTYAFANSLVGQNAGTQNFFIENLSTSKVLTLTGGASKVSIGGANPGDFVVNSASVSGTVTNGTPAGFTIDFNPTAVGPRSASITIQNDDCDESNYSFTVSGTGLSASNALNFDGAGDYIQIPSTTLMNFNTTDSFTVDFWFNTLSTSNQVLFTTFSNAAIDLGYEISMVAGKFRLVLSNNSISNLIDISTNSTYNDGIWHHAAFVYKGRPDAKYVDIVIDGLLSPSTISKNTLTGQFKNSNTPYLGARVLGGITSEFSGSLDEFRIWSQSFCAAELFNLSTCEQNGVVPKLKLAYSFNDGIGESNNTAITTVANATSGGNNGLLNGFAKTGSTSNFISVGGVLQGSSCSPIFVPQILVKAFTINKIIAEGDTTPSFIDSTNIGGVTIGSIKDNQFTITNSGAAPMNFINAPASVTCQGSAAFKIFGLVPVAPLSVGASISFRVRYLPTVPGIDSTYVTIYSNACGSPIFRFKLKATALEPPNIQLSQGPTQIIFLSGDTLDLGVIAVLKTTAPKLCSIKNTSVNGTLKLIGPPYVRRIVANDYTALTISQSALSASLPPGVSKDFDVRMYAGKPGYSYATMQILSNDPDTSIFLIPVKLRGVITGDINGNDAIDLGSEIAGDIDLSGGISVGNEIAGDVNGDRIISTPEFVGDRNGNFILDPGEVIGDISGNGAIDGSEKSGDTNGNGSIDGGEFTGDTNGNGVLDIPGEVVGDINGNGIIDNGEIAGDVNGDLILSASETTPPSYVMNGKPVISTNTVSQYSLVPPLPSYFTYAWQYSDETMLMVKDTTRSFMDIIANYATNDGTLACYIYQFGLPYDTVYYPIDVNKGYVNITELAQMDSACAQVNNPNNKCQNNYINFFKLNKINFDNNGCIQGGYQDLTESVYTTELEMGFNYTVELKPEKLFFIPNPLDPLNPDTVTMYYALWLDYNNDGDFEDAYEYLKNGDSKSLETKLINISIANNKNYEGSRRFRVAMRSGIGFSANESCSLVGESGEMEDYLVTLIPMKQLEGPNLLTPNNDGENDILSIKGVDAEKSREFTVMTKGGIIVYQSDDKDGNEFNSAWNGVDKNGKLLPKGTYYYIIKNGGAEFKTFLEIDY